MGDGRWTLQRGGVDFSKAQLRPMLQMRRRGLSMIGHLCPEKSMHDDDTRRPQAYAFMTND